MAEFREACARGDLNEVTRLLDASAYRDIFSDNTDFNLADDKGRTGFWLACQNNRLEVVAVLLKTYKVRVYQPRYVDGWTPFCYACMYGSLELVSLLKDSESIDVHETSLCNMSPRHSAVSNNRLDVVHLLDSDPRFKPFRDYSYNGPTPLYTAASLGYFEMASYLLNRPLPMINHPCTDTGTALHIACVRNDLKMVRLLLQSPKIDVNVQTRRGRETAFYVACHRGHVNIARELLRYPEINVDRCDVNHHTPLCAAMLQRNFDIIELLIHDPRISANTTFGDKVISYNPIRFENVTPLYACAQRGYLTSIELAFTGDRYVDPNIRYDNHTPEQIARRHGHERVAALIEEYRRDPYQTRHRLRHKRGVYKRFAAELFALAVLHCDGYLQFRPSPPNGRRFFAITAKLPMELQMVLCNRVYEVSQDNISFRPREAAFRHMSWRCSIE